MNAMPYDNVNLESVVVFDGYVMVLQTTRATEGQQFPFILMVRFNAFLQCLIFIGVAGLHYRSDFMHVFLYVYFAAIFL